MAPSICDAFDNTHVQYINDTLHINRSVFKPQFKHFTKYAKYAFLLLSSIYLILTFDNKDQIGKPKPLFHLHTISNKCAKYEHLPSKVEEVRVTSCKTSILDL